MKKVWIVLLTALMLAGCGGEQQETDSGYPEASVVVEASATVAPTETPTITATITNTPSPSPTQTATTTNTPTTTPFPFATPNGAYFVENSPDNKWIIWESWSGNSDHTLLIQKVNTSIIWDIQFHVTISDELRLPLFIRPIHWSREGRFMYFTGMLMGDGGSEYRGVSLVKRLDLENGDIANVLSFDTQFFSFTPSFTPNGRFFVHLSENILTFRDLQNSQETSIVIEEIDTRNSGSMLWSPDSTKLVFATEHSYASISFVVVDRNDMSYKFFPQEKVIFANAEEWLSENEVLFSIHFTYESKEVILNIQTGEITEVEE